MSFVTAGEQKNTNKKTSQIFLHKFIYTNTYLNTLKNFTIRLIYAKYIILFNKKKPPFREAFLNKIYHLTTTATGLRKAVKNIECYRY